MDCEIVHRVLHGSNACKQGTLIGLPDGKLSVMWSDNMLHLYQPSETHFPVIMQAKARVFMHRETEVKHNIYFKKRERKHNEKQF